MRQVPPQPPTMAGQAVCMPSFGAYVRRGRLVVPDNTALPDRCIKCNRRVTGGRIERTISYNASREDAGAWKWVPFIGDFIRVAFGVRKALNRKRLTVSYCICDWHRRLSQCAMVGVAVCVVAGLALTISQLVLPTMDASGLLLALGAFVMLVAVPIALASAHLRVTKGLHGTAEMAGAGKAFLESMPTTSGPVPVGEG